MTRTARRGIRANSPTKWSGPIGPIDRYQSTATVGGHTWTVYRGSNGSNYVYSFSRTSNSSSGTVDITAVCNWTKSRLVR